MAKNGIPSFLFLFLFVSLAMFAIHPTEADVVAIYIFGDSTVDVGTNNNLPESRARANFPFNGIDYPDSIPTGRFSNGLNTADQLVILLGYNKSPPPFLSVVENTSSFKSNMMHGLNFASGGSGLLDETGQEQYGRVISLGEKIQQFTTVRCNITEVIGTVATGTLLSKSLFLVSTGSNDIFEYGSDSSRNLSKQEFIDTLQSTYQNHLKNLYNLGARKFGIIGVPPIGCCPNLRASNESGGCMKELNEFAQMFRSTTETLLQRLSSELKGMKYSLGNTYDMAMDIIDNQYVFDFNDVKAACCGAGNFSGEFPCVETSNLCGNRDKYLFWDWYHPTEAASKLAALTLHGGAERFVKPMNFSKLAEANV